MEVPLNFINLPQIRKQVVVGLDLNQVLTLKFRSKSQLVKIGGHFPSKGGDKTFFSIPHDHMINESRDLMGEIPSP